MDYITSPGVVIPVFVLLVLIIYYLISLTGLLREANEDLKCQVKNDRPNCVEFIPYFIMFNMFSSIKSELKSVGSFFKVDRVEEEP